MVYAEIDQSGKIEQFNMDTVIALSNDHKYSVMVPKKVKQNIFIKYKGKIDDLKYKLFIITIFYCIKEVIDEETKAVICKEYEGHEAFFKSEIIRLFRREGTTIRPRTISFGKLTKTSAAHSLAISTLRRNIKPNLILRQEDIEKIIDARQGHGPHPQS